MPSRKEVVEILKEIRYFSGRKKELVKNINDLSSLKVTKKMEEIEEILSNGSIKLYDVYLQLYIEGSSQEGAAYSMGYTPTHMQRLNSQLITYLAKNLK